MKLIRKTNEAEMILEFLKGELNSKRFNEDLNNAINELGLDSSIILNGNIEDEQENNDREIYYYDLLDPTGVVFYQNNDKNNFLKLVKTTPVIDYIEALGLGKMKYSYEDMLNILAEIEAIYEYSDTNVLKLD